MTVLYSPFLPCKTVSKTSILSCMIFCMIVIMYMLGSLPYDEWQPMTKPVYGLDFSLSYLVSRSSVKTSRPRTGGQAGQSYGQQCNQPVRLDRLGNYTTARYPY